MCQRTAVFAKIRSLSPHTGYSQHKGYYGGIRLFVRTAETTDGAHRSSIFRSSLTQLQLVMLDDKPDMEFDYVIQVAVFETEYALLASR